MSEQRYPEELQKKEHDAIMARRNAANLAGKNPRVGLALSGGGIRSATFALGLLQSLARHKLLRQIDFLSTVSGGGYIGSFLGRLYSRTDLDKVSIEFPDAPSVVDQVEAILPDSRCEPMDWLRENGRYLSPNGSGDSLIAAAVYLRNWSAVVIVWSVYLLLGLLILNAIRYCVRHFAPLDTSFVDSFESVLLQDAFWWSPYIYVPAFLGVVTLIPLAWTYWLVLMPRPVAKGDSFSVLRYKFLRYLAWITHLVVIGLAILGWFSAPPLRILCGLVCLTAVLAIGYYVGARWTWLSAPMNMKGPQASDADRDRHVRHLLSRWLGLSLATALIALLLALIDSVGQSLYSIVINDASVLLTLIGSTVAFIAAAAVTTRKVSSILINEPDKRRMKLPMKIVVNLAAVGVLLIIGISLSTLSHGIAWGWHVPAGNPGETIAASLVASAAAPIRWNLEKTEEDTTILVSTPESARPVGRSLVEKIEGPMSWKWLFGAIGVLLLLSWFWSRIWSFINRSSYHMLYTARLTRAYLGASNSRRWSGPRLGVTRVVDGDGISLKNYKPHERGGPLHLVNVTLNETVSGKSQIEQRDRKGLGMAVSHFGVSVGRRHHALWTDRQEEQRDAPGAESQGATRDSSRTGSGPEYKFLSGIGDPKKRFQIFVGDKICPEPLALEQWVSISGAAFSTGLGMRTSAALSLLCGLFNIRLGYWWNSGMGPEQRHWKEPTTIVNRVGRKISSAFPLQMYLLDEFTGRFHGPARNHWYLSDGGHFENMGVYELIRRRLPLIILSDAEQDAEFRYSGLANLIRKARIDLDAEITFLGENELDDLLHESVRPLFGTKEQLRRGRWSQEPVGDGNEKQQRLSIDEPPDPSRLSLAHASLAWIKYNGTGERSLLLYIKPTLTGDEPSDVLQYHSSHSSFPHESTIDQFFDEEQWESYRVLGEHIGNQLFQPPAGKPGKPPDGEWTPHGAICSGPATDGSSAPKRAPRKKKVAAKPKSAKVKKKSSRRRR